jgi:hypothetical protein
MSAFISTQTDIDGINIDGINFRINKIGYSKIGNSEKTGLYKTVEIISYGEEEGTYTFKVYASNSELGMWRYCFIYSNLFYKGNPNKKFKDGKLTYTPDYTQTTLIHLDLQKYINNYIKNKEFITELPSCISADRWCNISPDRPKKSRPKGFENCDISSGKRQILEEPFSRWQSFLECGHTEHISIYRFYILKDRIKKDLISLNKKNKIKYENNPTGINKAISDEFESLYNLESIEIIDEDYENNFRGVINSNGMIVKAVLIRKTPIEGGKTNRVYLYFLVVKLDKVNSKNPDDLLEKICSRESHFMPILLTVPEAKCNFMGLYDQYIPSGSFMCKLFDYNKQSTKEERSLGQVDYYSYIGDRYNGIFPYKNINVNLCSIPPTINIISASSSLGGQKPRTYKKNVKKPHKKNITRRK